MGHGVVGPLGFVVGIVLLAAVGSRLLGLRLSWRRALLTGFPSLVAGFAAGYLVNRRHPGQITPLVLIASVVAAMLLTVLAELMARPGARTGTGGPPRPLRALRWTISRTFRCRAGRSPPRSGGTRRRRAWCQRGGCGVVRKPDQKGWSGQTAWSVRCGQSPGRSDAPM